jgi:hypothetical protein
VLTALLTAQRVPIQLVCALDALLLSVLILPLPDPVAVFQLIKLYSTERVFHFSAVLSLESTIQVTTLVSTARPRIVWPVVTTQVFVQFVHQLTLFHQTRHASAIQISSSTVVTCVRIALQIVQPATVQTELAIPAWTPLLLTVWLALASVQTVLQFTTALVVKKWLCVQMANSIQGTIFVEPVRQTQRLVLILLAKSQHVEAHLLKTLLQTLATATRLSIWKMMELVEIAHKTAHHAPTRQVCALSARPQWLYLLVLARASPPKH